MELNLKQATDYLETKGIITPLSTLRSWLQRGYVSGWKDLTNRWYTTTENIDDAISSEKIPPVYSRFTEEQKAEMTAMKKSGMKLREIAKIFKCDDSYVSLVYRGLR